MRQILNRIKLFFLITIAVSCNDNINEPEITPENKNLAITPPIAPYYPIPSKNQLEWQNSELAMFIHYGINTYTGEEWGTGDEDPSTFNPTSVDVKQWIDVAKEIGFKYVVLTEHHDGFCLWPSKYTEHSIKNSPYKNGNGDIVKEFADACKAAGLKFSFYLSPWDRHEESYGSDQYNKFYQNQLIELLTNYGEVGEIWMDNANGEEPDGKKQDYNIHLFYNTIRNYQPEALIAINGPDIRWVGNENGLASEEEWSIVPANYRFPNPGIKVWYPTECDVSIRPGWFYHNDEDSKVKSLDHLIDIYFKSVGRNSNLLINVPPNINGKFSEIDVQRLREWKSKLDKIFERDILLNQKINSSSTLYNSEEYSAKNAVDGNRNTFWTPEDTLLNANLFIKLDQTEKLNIIKIEEAIAYGQRVKEFILSYRRESGNWIEISRGTTIGKKRLLRFPVISADELKLEITESLAPPTIRIFSAYYNEIAGID